VHELNAGEHRRSWSKGFEASHRPRHAFEDSVILLDDVFLYRFQLSNRGLAGHVRH
jgi:hypothetical protein